MVFFCFCLCGWLFGFVAVKHVCNFFVCFGSFSLLVFQEDVYAACYGDGFVHEWFGDYLFD